MIPSYVENSKSQSKNRDSSSSHPHRCQRSNLIIFLFLYYISSPLIYYNLFIVYKLGTTNFKATKNPNISELIPKPNISSISHSPTKMLHDHLFDSDGFDRISDDLILLIFNRLSDIKDLARCRSVSQRFNSLVPKADNLLVKVDCVISSETSEWILLHVLRSLLHSLQYFISPKRSLIPPRNPNSPSEILRVFEKIKRLEIELPSGDLRLEKGTILRWKAQFGKSLKSCVILAVRSMETCNLSNSGDRDEDLVDQIDFNTDNGGGLKLRVVWTISALIAASARHYLLREVIKEHKEMEKLLLRDREGEGTVVMDKDGLREFREGEEEGEAHISRVGWKNRTTVPAVRMRMRHASCVDLSGGVRIRGATLVTVRPTDGVETTRSEIEDEMEDRGFVVGAFDGVFQQTVDVLLKSPSYLLEMNSF